MTRRRSPGASPRRGALAALALLLAAGPLFGQAPPPPSAALEAEEAAEFARRAAFAALRGPQKIFLESIDADGVLRRLLGGSVWGGLTSRQQGLLRSAVREEFGRALEPAAGTEADVAWAAVASAPSADGPFRVDLGLRYGSSVLKTRWSVRQTPRGWTVDDIALVDPGLSLSSEIARMLGPDPVRPRDAAREARSRALPRILGLAAIAVVVAVFARRLPRGRRPLLFLTAAVPAALFAIDGTLAARRALSERYALAEAPPGQPWRKLEKEAQDLQREGSGEAARAAWSRSIEAGAPPGPAHFQMGLAARSRGDMAQAREDFARALRQTPPALGAMKELAAMALAEGRSAEAARLYEDYLREAGPDPDSLAALAVAQSNAGDPGAAARAMAAARALVPDGARRAELEAQIHARAGNAADAVSALRPLVSEGRLSRAALRADPAYLPIAADPAWVAFLDEAP